MPKRLDEFSAKQPIFIDANIFLSHAFDVNSACVDFLQKVESSSVKAVTSSLVLEEVFFKLLMQSASNFVEKATVDKLKSAMRNDTNKQQIFKPVREYGKYIRILKDAGMTILALKGEDMMLAIDKAETHNLIIADAAHLAVMEQKGIVHIASADGDFAAIPTITQWSPAA
jgi:predicted nucleic acid-binding protein